MYTLGHMTQNHIKNSFSSLTPQRFCFDTPAGKTDDAKASEKVKTPCKSPIMQRSPSDAGKSSGDEGKKSGVSRPPPAAGSFAFKKVSAPSDPAPKSLASKSSGKVGGAGPVMGGARKTSLDGYRHHDDGVLVGMGASKMPFQSHSLPRPAKSYRTVESPDVKRGGAGLGATAGLGFSAATVGRVSKRKDGANVESGRSSPVSINQTDKEKVSGFEQEGSVMSLTGQSGLRQPGSKYLDIASPTFRR